MNSDESPRAFLEFFRRDLGAKSQRILIPAGVLVFIGAPGVCFGAAVKGSGALHLGVGIGGAITLLAGLFLGFVGMARLIGHDAYVAIAQDGLVLHLDKSETFHAWADMKSIVATDTGFSLELAGADSKTVSVVGRFGGLSPAALAERLDDWRRKSDWNLKPPGPPEK